MSLKPRNTIDDNYIGELVCSICGRPNLRVAHLDKYPDFVSCTNCDAAFVLEDKGDWIMYGKIPADYPETRKFALKQWTWHDAVRQRAEEEREGVSPGAASEPATPIEVPPVAKPDLPATPTPTPESRLRELSEAEPAGTEPSPPFVGSPPTDVESVERMPADESTIEDLSPGEAGAPAKTEPAPSPEEMIPEIEQTHPAEEPAGERKPSAAVEETAPESGLPDELIPSGSETSPGTFPPPPTFGEPDEGKRAQIEGTVEAFAGEETAAEQTGGDQAPEAAEPRLGEDASENREREEKPSEGETTPESVSPFVSQSGADFFESDEDPSFLTDIQAASVEGKVEFLAEPAAEEVEEEPSVSPFIDRLEKELKASEEPSSTPEVSAETGVEPPLPFGSPISEQQKTPQAQAPFEGQTEKPAPVPEPITEAAEMESEPEYDSPAGEPEAGIRYRVVVKGSQLKFPKNVCAHDLRRPVSLGATVRGTLPDPNNPGNRNPLEFSLPLCKDCKRRADARSDEERSALLQAHLISGIVAVFLVVIALVAGFVNVVEEPLISIFILLLLGVLGYGLPAIFLLSRANRFPPPYDAAYVLSTLLVVDDAGDLQTSFEWRNEGYAELFRQVNRHNVIGEIARIPDKLTLSEPHDPMEEELDSEETSGDMRQPKPEAEER